ncbi:uncharacterized protein LOC117115516 [Anneissia japonica]|uniref:uncharacterized protein LOC117115516 n=1 Tax=Anneissia japonica TaxID=1529436 RepID=UPI0014259EDA|nr:uncharacterized protein LOC117115516 [Anneissia japonica]
MYGVTSGTHQQFVGDLSPPYDGSEMDLFPDLSFLDSVQTDFLNNGFDDELASAPYPIDNAMDFNDQCQAQAELVPDVKQGIVSPNSNPTLVPKSSKGKSVIKVMVTSSKDESELVNFLMGKAQNCGPTPTLKIIKKAAVSAQPDLNHDVTNTPHQEMKIDSTRPVKENVNVRPRPVKSQNLTKSKEMSLIEQLEKDLQVCDPMNRNAIAARLNRLRKKNHVEGLEESVNNLKTENAKLLENNTFLNARVSSLETEVSYLKGILANQSSLSLLLSNIQATNLNFHTSMETIVDKSEDIDSITQSKAEEEIDVVGVSCDQIKVPLKRKRTQTDESENLYSEQIDNKIIKKEGKTVPRRSNEGERRKSDRLIEQKTEFSKDIPPTAGVCLHVSGKNVSLEFCYHCSRRAQTTIQVDTSASSRRLVKDEI